MFDPYHRWLAIPPGQRPPTYYQLLGVAPDENDAEVITEAALRQTSHVRTYQTGPHAAECTALLNEIGQARATLLNAAKRKEYDARLAAPPTSATPPPLPPPAAARPAALDSFAFAPPVEAERARPRRRSSRPTPWWADTSLLAFVVLLVGGAGLGFGLAVPRPAPPAAPAPAKAPPPGTKTLPPRASP
jgi:hypothetical protein